MKEEIKVMNEENALKLYAAFPYLYRDQRGFAIGDGWFNLVFDLSKSIEAEARKLGLKPTSPDWPLVLIVKENLGVLYFSISTSPRSDDLTGLRPLQLTESIRKLIADAETKSSSICEDCGQPGKLMDDDYFTKSTLCDSCAGKRKYLRDQEKEFEESEIPEDVGNNSGFQP